MTAAMRATAIGGGPGSSAFQTADWMGARKRHRSAPSQARTTRTRSRSVYLGAAAEPTRISATLHTSGERARPDPSWPTPLIDRAVPPTVGWPSTIRRAPRGVPAPPPSAPWAPALCGLRASEILGLAWADLD